MLCPNTAYSGRLDSDAILVNSARVEIFVNEGSALAADQLWYMTRKNTIHALYKKLLTFYPRGLVSNWLIGLLFLAPFSL
jgi:hypothetical protein